MLGELKAFKSSHGYRCSHTCSGLYDFSEKSGKSLIKAFTSESLERGRETGKGRKNMRK